MTAKFLAGGLLALLLMSTSNSSSQTQAHHTKTGVYHTGRASKDDLYVVPDLAERLAKWKPVEMPFHSEGLTARERQEVEKLVEACRYLEDIYWRQSDPEGLTLYQELAGSQTPRDLKLRRFLFINGGRFDLLDNFKPFVGREPMPPGRGFYSQGLTREQIEQYVKDHPEQKNDIFSPYTVVRQNGEQLHAIKYSVAYRSFLEPAAKALREAAALSSDKDFAKFLRMRADALLSDDYYPSDLAWLDLKDPKIDVIFAPYETYMDGLLGVKASYGPAVLVRNESESKKLDIFQQYVPDLQEALPLAPRISRRRRACRVRWRWSTLRIARAICGTVTRPLQIICRTIRGFTRQRDRRRFSSRTSWTHASPILCCRWRSPDDSESSTESYGRGLFSGHAGA